ncbi:MAG: sodium/glutamate symporter [Treponemataceae bacterium]
MLTLILLQNLIKHLAGLLFFLLIGMLCYKRIPIFRRFFLPPSVIAGFLALFCNPSLWNVSSGVLNEFYTSWSILPSAFIVPIFVASQLNARVQQVQLKKIPTILMWGGLFSACGSSQMVVGFGITLLFNRYFPQINLYNNFGYELSQGFSGGHGTAAAVANFFQTLNLPHWQEAQGVTSFFASIGLFFGMIFGIFFVNHYYKKKRGIDQTLVLDGQNCSTNKEEKLTNENAPVITISMILFLCSLSYFLLDYCKNKKIAFFSSIPVWFYGILLAQLVSVALAFFKKNDCIDEKTKKQFISFFSDIIIIAALATMPIKTIMQYFIPILAMSLAGFLITFLISFPLMKFIFGADNFSFERGIMNWGVTMGVMVNGLTLLRMCDPQLKTPVLNDFACAFSFMIVTGFAIAPITYNLLSSKSTIDNFLFALATVFFYIAIAIVGKLLQKCFNTKKAS